MSWRFKKEREEEEEEKEAFVCFGRALPGLSRGDAWLERVFVVGKRLMLYRHRGEKDS
jgi:hypothetical protein